MSLFKRMSQVFQQKANAALDKIEDPTQALDLSYQKLLEQLQAVRRSIADVLTAEKRLEAQRANLQAQYDKLQGQAKLALQQGQEDLARTALQRAQVVSTQLEGLGPQIDQLKAQESQLELTGQKLAAKVEAFRAQKDTMKAQYTAAKASTQAMEGISGISEHMADVSLMIERAQDKVADMQARASAVGELADSGVLDTLSVGPAAGDDIDRQLKALQGDQSVEAQLEAMKRELSGAKEAPALGAPTLVVRVLGEGQYRVPEAVRPALDGLEFACTRAMEADDEAGFTKCAQQLLALLEKSGEKLPPDDVRPSDLVVPSPSMTLAEAKSLVGDQAQPAGSAPGAAPSGEQGSGSADGVVDGEVVEAEGTEAGPAGGPSQGGAGPGA